MRDRAELLEALIRVTDSPHEVVDCLGQSPEEEVDQSLARLLQCSELIAGEVRVNYLDIFSIGRRRRLELALADLRENMNGDSK